jgi:hypothetical protein
VALGRRCDQELRDGSGDGDALVATDVLKSVKEFDALCHGPLERCASRNEPVAAGALLITAVRTAAARSPDPFDSPPELMSPILPMEQLATCQRVTSIELSVVSWSCTSGEVGP